MCKRGETENYCSVYPITDALTFLKTDDKAERDQGFDMLQKLADAGDMTAAAYVGYAAQFKHIGHYDLNRCREYLEWSAMEGDSMGMYFLGMMLMEGTAPFDQDKIRGKWLLENAGCPEAEKFLADWYREEMTEDEAKKMMVKSGLWLGWEWVKNLFKHNN